jgi:hypothetical protein
MSLLKLSLFVLVVFLNEAVFGEKFAFTGYKLLKIQPTNDLHIETVSQWEHNVDVGVFFYQV